MIGTAFEALGAAEPGTPRQAVSKKKRILILGAGVSGAEAARVAAGRGHHVEIWEKADRVGGQIHLATAAPNKEEARAAWTYRWEQVRALGVPVRTSVDATAQMIRDHRADLVVVATGALPKPAPFDPTQFDTGVRVLTAWEVLGNPDTIPKGARVTIVGGGSVGVETADLLVTRSCAVTLIEVGATAGLGIARSNRMELLDRLQAAKVEVLTNTQIIEAAGTSLRLNAKDTRERSHPIGDFLLIAVGAVPNLAVLAAVEAAGAHYTTIGDCYQPGDFMSCLRDAWMVGIAIDSYAERTVSSLPLRLS